MEVVQRAVAGVVVQSNGGGRVVVQRWCKGAGAEVLMCLGTEVQRRC